MSRIVAPSSISDSWMAFERALAGAIGDLDEDEFLVIERKHTNYFVQFAAQGLSGLRAEAVANVYLPRPERILESTIRQLKHMGWKMPTYVQTHEHSEPIDGSPNFYLDVAVSVPFEVISALAIETLRGPFGVRHPGELEYEGYSDRLTSIRFPQLGIERRVSAFRSTSGGPSPDLEEAPVPLMLPVTTMVC